MFAGRHTVLALPTKRVAQVTRTGSGVAVALRGRRQVGKSRLVQELLSSFLARTRGRAG